MALKLPLTITSRPDVARVLRELNSLEDFMTQAAVREPGTAMQLPKLSRPLDDLAQENGQNLLDQTARQLIHDHLNLIMGKAPAIHVSFAVEPSPKALHVILLWFRENIHPQVLLQVGLQPTITVGMVVRTPNLFFDMSMRQYLQKQEPYLTQLLKETARAE